MFNFFKKKSDNSTEKYSTAEYIKRLSECNSLAEKNKVYDEEHKKWNKWWDALSSYQRFWDWLNYPPPPVPPGYKWPERSYSPEKPVPPPGYEE